MSAKEQQTTTAFERIFHPRRMAIVGVSAEGGAHGFGIGMFTSLKAMNFSGEIFPVNPKGGEFAGVTFYKKIEDIPGKIDFAIIAVSAKDVPEALEACRKKGAAGAEILSAQKRGSSWKIKYVKSRPKASELWGRIVLAFTVPAAD